MNEPEKITPLEFTMSPDDAIKKSLVLFVICIGTAAYFLWSFSTGRHQSSLGYLIAVICFIYPIISCLYARFPISVSIDHNSNAIAFEYLNGFGTQKSGSIDLNDAYVRYTSRYRLNENDMQVRITQSIINNWIYIDKTHGFNQDQIKLIYDAIKSR